MSRLPLILSATLAILACACVDPEVEAPVVEQVETQQQAVTVVPAFSISGVSSLPDGLHLTELGFVVSEIRLEPLASQPGSVAFSAVKPEVIRFDVAGGEDLSLANAIELPKPGRYLVSVRLEPIDSDTTGELVPSFQLSGFVAQDSVRVDSRYAVAGDDDGERPTPHPFDPDDDEIHSDDADGLSDSPDELESWTPFHYHSERAVFFTLNVVEFQEGETQLDFNFDVHNWALDIVEPISRAVDSDEFISGSHSDAGVDISRHLDSSGQGAESFVTFGRASAMPGPSQF